MTEENLHFLRELDEIAVAIRNAQNLEALRPLFYRLGEIAANAPGDIDVLASVGDRKREIAEAGARMGRPLAVAAAASASPSAPPVQDAGMLPTALMPLPEAGVTRPMPSRNYTPPAPTSKWPKWTALGVALAALIAVGIWAGLRYFAKPSNPAVAIEGPQTQPAQPQSAPVVDTASGAVQSLSLQVALERATISLDGASPIAAGAPPARFENLAPGQHTVRLSADGAEASFQFDAVPGKPPVVIGAAAARGATVFLVSHSGGLARLVTSAGSWQLSLNGQPEGEAGPGGLALKHWKNGTNEFALGDGPEPIRFQAASEQGPSLAAFVLPVPVVSAMPAGAAAPQRMAVIPPPPSQPKPVSLDEPPAAVKPASTPVPVAAVTPTIASPPPPAPTPAPAPAKPAPAARKRGSIADFADSSAWRTEGDLTRSTRPGFHVFGATGAGAFQFDVLAEHGGKARWTAGYTDPNNYRLFEIDGETLSAYEVVKGARKRVARAPLAGSGEKRWRVKVDVAPGAINHAVHQAGAWTTVDTWIAPGRDLAAGRFGFLIQGQERIALTGFSFEPR